MFKGGIIQALDRRLSGTWLIAEKFIGMTHWECTSQERERFFTSALDAGQGERAHEIPSALTNM